MFPSCRNQSINLQSRLINWFLHDRENDVNRFKGICVKNFRLLQLGKVSDRLKIRSSSSQVFYRIAVPKYFSIAGVPL